MAGGGISADLEARLLPVLEDARRLGLLGPGAPLPHLGHALGFGTAAEAVGGAEFGRGGGAGRSCLDLGSGAGLPGLPLALAWPASRWVLVDAGRRRVEFLLEAVVALGLGDRVEVVNGRAEELAHQVRLRGRFELVVARGFAPPAVTAECAAGFLVVDGQLVVSEPPGGRPERWPASGLAPLGLDPPRVIEGADASYAVLRQATACPDRYPRRAGIPTKRPLFVTD